MKGYPQPLSEAFVYSSPEGPAAGSFRWIAQKKTETSVRSIVKKERTHGFRRSH